MSARQILGACALGAYLLVLGFLGGMVASAMRFDGQRAAVLSRLDEASARVRAQLMRFEHDAARSAESRDQSARSVPGALHAVSAKALEAYSAPPRPR
jgi:hypothetical protein